MTHRFTSPKYQLTAWLVCRPSLRSFSYRTRIRWPISSSCLGLDVVGISMHSAACSSLADSCVLATTDRRRAFIRERSDRLNVWVVWSSYITRQYSMPESAPVSNAITRPTNRRDPSSSSKVWRTNAPKTSTSCASLFDRPRLARWGLPGLGAAVAGSDCGCGRGRGDT